MTTKEFSRDTNKSTFKSNHHSNIHTTTVYSLHTQDDLPPWITAATNGTRNHHLRHPITLTHHPYNLPNNFNLSKLHNFTSIHSVFHHVTAFDKLLVVPTPTPKFNRFNNSINYNYYYYDDIDLKQCSLLALYDGGKLRGCPRSAVDWVKISKGRTVDKFDDIVIFNGMICALDRQGILYLINNYVKSRKFCIGKALSDSPVGLGSGRFGWRKRLVVDGNQLYLVVRMEEKLFRVYKLSTRKKVFSWGHVKRFDCRQMLFMMRDYYLFWQSWDLGRFPGRRFENCIMFSEAAFPQYGNGCWEVSRFDGDVRGSDEDIAVFWFDGEDFGREGDGGAFPKLNWSPPRWVSDVCSGLAAESQSHSSSECNSQSKREPVEDEGLDSNSKEENEGEMQSELIGKDKEQEVIESDSDSKDQDGKMQCDLNSWENEDARDDATEQGTSMKRITQSIPAACTTKRHGSESVTTKFEGFDVRFDSVSTLQKIWQKHGNIIENITLRSGDIIARALESLVTMVRMLEDNSALSLSGSQAEYLSSTLSDLRYMCFEVCWLSPFVEKAVKLHKSKHLFDSLNNLSHLSSQFKKRRTMLFDELTKLVEEENKVKEEMAKVSKMIPFSGQVNFEEPLGSGLT